MRKNILRFSLVGSLLALLCVSCFMPARQASAATPMATWTSHTTLTLDGTTYTDCNEVDGCGGATGVYIQNGLTITDSPLACDATTKSSANKGKKFLHIYSGYAYLVTITGAASGPVNINTCTSSVTINFTNTQPADPNASTNCSDGSTKTSDGTCKNGTDDTVDCGADGLNWLACPVIAGMAKATKSLDTFIMDTLDTDVKAIFDETATKTSLSNGYYTAWSGFRVIATALLVIAGLIMVVSQALGFEFLDAYTIRKTLPRLLVAIIGISLSWPLMRYVVSFFDTLGFDTRALIYAPFKDLNSSLGVAGGVLSYIAIGAGILTLGPATLTFILSALIAVFAGFLVLVLRQIAIILLIIIAPVAIACYVLPNTEKVWKLWHENFLGLLAAFPLISAVIATGHVFAAVAASRGSGANDTASLTAAASGMIHHFTGQTFSQTIFAAANNVGGVVADGMAITADYGPYFLIGTIITRTTGAISTALGGATNWLSGAANGLRDYRRNTAAKRFKAMQEQRLYDNNSKLGKGANKLLSAITDPINNGAYYGRKLPLLKKRGHAVESQIEHAKLEQSAKLQEHMNATYNDKAYRAMSGAHDKLSEETQQRLQKAGLFGEAPTSIKEMQAMSKILSQGSDSEKLAANAIQGSMGYIASMYKDPEMAKADVQAAAIMGLAAHGFADGDDLEFVGNQLQASGGTAYAQGVINRAQLMGSRGRPDLKNGYGIMYQNGKFVNGMDKNTGNRDLDLIGSLNSHDVAAAKSGFMTEPNIAAAYEEILVASQTPEYQAMATEYNDHYSRLTDEQKTAYAELNGSGRVKDLKRAAKAVSIHQAVKDQLMQWASPYSQASADVKAESIKLINKLSGKRGPQVRQKIKDGKPVYKPVQLEIPGQGIREVQVPDTEEYTGYAQGTLGYEYEQSVARGMSPEQIELMRKTGEQQPDVNTQQGQK